MSSFFIKDILDLYEGKDSLQNELKTMAAGIDTSNAMKFVPVETYNKMCNWIEEQIG
jgi:hypothetical protein